MAAIPTAGRSMAIVSLLSPEEKRERVKDNHPTFPPQSMLSILSIILIENNV